VFPEAMGRFGHDVGAQDIIAGTKSSNSCVYVKKDIYSGAGTNTFLPCCGLSPT
jgi:hypothetical protein